MLVGAPIPDAHNSLSVCRIQKTSPASPTIRSFESRFLVSTLSFQVTRRRTLIVSTIYGLPRDAERVLINHRAQDTPRRVCSPKGPHSHVVDSGESLDGAFSLYGVLSPLP